MNEQSKPNYETGGDFWRDTAAIYGKEEALGICGRYLEMQLKTEQPPDEHQFCRELFTAMYEDAAKTTDPAKLVYPYELYKANDRAETSHYHDSRKQNTVCIEAINEAIYQSNYKRNHYNLDLAAMKVIHEFGFERVNMALAKNIQQREHDERFSNSNKQWAKEYEITPKTFDGASLYAHPTLLDDFTTYTRDLYTELKAERFALPGRQPEQGDVIHGYEIIRAVEFNTDRGFAIGLNPFAVNEFVTWQFTTENGARDYYWGNYFDTFAEAAQNYIARTIVHMSGGGIHEMQRQRTFEFEKSAEQNYNMIDGLVNNAPPELDLTDGQTHEEIKELAPETLLENKTQEQSEHEPDIPAHPEENEAALNIAAWIAVTESSRFRWVEDEIVRLNGRGAMYYTGGEDGIYMRISNDGKLEAGNYEAAFPHIGDAFFIPLVVKQFDNFSDAYKAAMEAGGKQFLTDMFSGGERQPLFKAIGKEAADDKASVIKQIREAQSAPKPPAKNAPELGRKKTEPEL